MAIFSPSSNSLVFSGDKGNRVVFADKASVSAALGIGDKVRMVKIPAGTKVDRVVVTNGDLDSGTTLTDKIGYEHCDGSGGDDDAFCASGATTRRGAVADPSPTIYEFATPIAVEKDSWVTLTCVAAATGLAATVDVACKVLGEAMGAK